MINWDNWGGNKRCFVFFSDPSERIVPSQRRQVWFALSLSTTFSIFTTIKVLQVAQKCFQNICEML